MGTDRVMPESEALAALAERVTSLEAEVRRLREPEDEATRWRHGERDEAPASGEDVARMMREAWPGPDWQPDPEDDAVHTAVARSGRLCLDVWYTPAGASSCWSGAIEEDGSSIANRSRHDLPALVAAMREDYARLLADLRALAPGGAPTTDAAPSRTAADVAREALADLARAALALRVAWANLPITCVHFTRIGTSATDADEARARLSAELAALTSAPAPAPDPLAGLPAEVARAVRETADDGLRRSIPSTPRWEIRRVCERVGRSVVLVLRDDAAVSALNVAPDGTITREPQL